MNIIHWTNPNLEEQPKSVASSYDTLPIINKKITKKQKQESHSSTYKQLYKEQKLSELVKKAIENESHLYLEYDQIKIKGEVLNVNDYVTIKNGDNTNEDYIGKILRICSIQEPTTQKLICLCEITWFMRKSEILQFIPRARNWMGSSEVFSTKTSDFILAQTIIDKCQILDSDEYSNLENYDSNIYFSRLEWDNEQKRLTNFNNIPTYCICQQPWNPEQNYIQCDQCQKWYHFKCIDIEEGTYDEKQEFVCKYCH